MEILNLFPIAICYENIDRKFTKKELEFVKQCGIDCRKNAGNIRSKNSYVLEEKVFKNLKIKIQKYINEYIEKIICPNKKIECYITQSWLNYTKPSQYHHEHNHVNSYLSGVLYFNADEKFDKIVFHKNEYPLIRIPIKKYNLYNSETWFLENKTGLLLLFPSNLKHSVPFKQGKNTRISLSFNTFIKGQIGTEEHLTELKLNV